MSTPARDRVPVTVLTGFLGSGKTTLLNHILTAQHGKRIAVIENEFGEIGVDQDLVIRADEEIFEMNNGCICCSVRGDLIRILGTLLKRKDRFDYVLIETTGLADPGPVAQTFFVDEEIQAKTRLDGIVTVVDAYHVAQHWDANEVKEQIAFADVILLNKTDLVAPPVLDALEKRIRSMNTQAKVYRTQNSTIDMGKILDVGGFDLDRILAASPDFLQEEGHHDHDHHPHDHHDHEPHDHGHDHGHKHRHDEEVGSVGLSVPGDLDLDKFNTWLQELLAERGPDIYRMKGVLSIQGDPRRYVFQGIHMLFDGRPDREWGPAERSNKLVFIGKKLDRQALTEGFRACLA